MSQRPNHPTPSHSVVFRAQLALLLAPPRIGFLVGTGFLFCQSVLLAATGILFGVQVTIGETGTTLAMPRLSSVGVEHGLGAWAFMIGALALVGIFFNARVWRGAKGERRHYHWALPVEKRTHDLLRVAAGATGLAVISMIFLVATVLTAWISGHGEEIGRFPITAWFAALLGPQLLYLLFSALEIAGQGQRRRWTLYVLGGWLALFAALGAMVDEPFLQAIGRIIWGPFGLVTAVSGPTLEVLLEGRVEVPGPWLPAFALWALFALVSLVAAASDRPRDD